MVAVPVLAIASFLLWSDAADAVRGGTFEPLDTTPAADPTGPSLIVVVLDELPTASIVDESGAIDRARFPNLARLGDDATWYRNATTVVGWTVAAVPSILTGRLAGTTAPLWTEQPDNLFRLLAPTHDLVVSESLTRLCPVEVCGERPSAPAPTGSAPTPPERVDADRGALLRDAVDVMHERLTGAGSGDRFDDFVEELVAGGRCPRPRRLRRIGRPDDALGGHRHHRPAPSVAGVPRRWSPPIGRSSGSCTSSSLTSPGSCSPTAPPTEASDRSGSPRASTGMRGPPVSPASFTSCRPATPTRWSASCSTIWTRSTSTTTRRSWSSPITVSLSTSTGTSGPSPRPARSTSRGSRCW